MQILELDAVYLLLKSSLLVVALLATGVGHVLCFIVGDGRKDAGGFFFLQILLLLVVWWGRFLIRRLVEACRRFRDELQARGHRSTVLELHFCVLGAMLKEN
jgi:hypothetical protein